MAKKMGGRSRPFDELPSGLEAELRSCGYAKVVVGAVVEVHFVADINTQADRSGECFDADTRIKDSMRVSTGYATHRPDKAAYRSLVGAVEVDKSSLQGPEDAPCAGAGDELR